MYGNETLMLVCHFQGRICGINNGVKGLVMASVVAIVPLIIQTAYFLSKEQNIPALDV